MGPVSEFALISTCMRGRRYPMEVGILDLRKLECKSRYCRAIRQTIEDGIVDEIKLLFRSI